MTHTVWVIHIYESYICMKKNFKIWLIDSDLLIWIKWDISKLLSRMILLRRLFQTHCHELRTPYRTNKNFVPKFVPRTEPNETSYQKSVPRAVPYQFVPTVRPSMLIVLTNRTKSINFYVSSVKFKVYVSVCYNGGIYYKTFSNSSVL